MQRSLVLAAVVQSLGHALASPLGLIRGRAELLARAQSRQDAEQTAARILEQVDRVLALLDRVRAFAAALEPAEQTPVGEQLEQALCDRAVAIELGAGARELAGRLPDGSVALIVSGLEAYALEHGGAIELDRAERDGSVLLSLRLALPPGAPLPQARGALCDPWLEPPSPDAAARFELGLALHVLRACGGSHEHRAKPSPELLLFLPIPS